MTSDETVPPGLDPINLALRELSRVVCLEYEPWSTEGKRIMEVAKAIYQKSGPRELDCLVTGIPGHPCIAGNNAVAVVFPLQPAWATYWAEAVAAIEAMDKADTCPQD